MTPRPPQSLGRQHRLQGRRGFESLFRRGRRLDGPYFLLITAPNDRGLGRLGVAVGKKIGNAVNRNHAKRILREGFRRSAVARAQGADFVLVAKATLKSGSATTVAAELDRRVRSLQGPRPRRREDGEGLAPAH